jgi:hypothetical protein
MFFVNFKIINNNFHFLLCDWKIASINKGEGNKIQALGNEGGMKYFCLKKRNWNMDEYEGTQICLLFFKGQSVIAIGIYLLSQSNDDKLK